MKLHHNMQRAITSFLVYFSGGKFIESSEKGSGPIWLADLECTGNEYSPVLCPFFGWGDTGCTHQFDMAVECSPPEGTILFEVYFVNGGNVNIKH